MDKEQDAARRFVREILRATGWAPSDLAKRAGISHTTLTRFLNNGDVKHTLSSRTIAKIRAAAAKEIPADQIDALWLISQRAPAQAQRDEHPD